jgi:transposase-like protein
MTKRARRYQTPAFKAKGALAAVKGDKTLAELAQLFDVHPQALWPDMPASCRRTPTTDTASSSSVEIPETSVFADRRGILAYSYLPGFADDR